MTIEQAYRYDRRARERMTKSDTWGDIITALILALVVGALGAV